MYLENLIAESSKWIDAWAKQFLFGKSLKLPDVIEVMIIQIGLVKLDISENLNCIEFQMAEEIQSPIKKWFELRNKPTIDNAKKMSEISEKNYNTEEDIEIRNIKDSVYLYKYIP